MKGVFWNNNGFISDLQYKEIFFVKFTLKKEIHDCSTIWLEKNFEYRSIRFVKCGKHRNYLFLMLCLFNIIDLFIFTKQVSNIMEGVVVLHETIHEMRRKKDCGKAYDKIKWPFVQQTLRMKGFSEKWCSWINLVTTGGHVGIKTCLLFCGWGYLGIPMHYRKDKLSYVYVTTITLGSSGKEIIIKKNIEEQIPQIFIAHTHLSTGRDESKNILLEYPEII
ncbi:hypothetical protein ACJX0J_032487 [Zea mays]